MIGYIGCSNTSVAVQGYQVLGGTQFWTPSGQALHGITYGGGTLPSWAAGGYWNTFINFYRAEPCDKIWLQVCLRSSETQQQGMDAAEIVVAKLTKNLPGVPIFVSALNGYREMNCGITGPDGPAKSRAVRDWMTVEGLAAMGPILGALYPSQLLYDDCHPNDKGAQVLGQKLVDFFGT